MRLEPLWQLVEPPRFSRLLTPARASIHPAAEQRFRTLHPMVLTLETPIWAVIQPRSWAQHRVAAQPSLASTLLSALATSSYPPGNLVMTLSRSSSNR